MSCMICDMSEEEKRSELHDCLKNVINAITLKECLSNWSRRARVGENAMHQSGTQRRLSLDDDASPDNAASQEIQLTASDNFEINCSQLNLQADRGIMGHAQNALEFYGIDPAELRRALSHEGRA